MQSRVVTSRPTSIGAPVRKPVRDVRPSAKRGRARASHQDTRSLLIAAAVGLIVVLMVGTLWFYLREHPQVADVNIGRPPPAAADLDAKKTHSYWKVGRETYHHYITDTATGQIIDAGDVTVKDMLAEGIEVPGYSQLDESDGGGAGVAAEALAIRFKALREHLQ